MFKPATSLQGAHRKTLYLVCGCIDVYPALSPAPGASTEDGGLGTGRRANGSGRRGKTKRRVQANLRVLYFCVLLRAFCEFDFILIFVVLFRSCGLSLLFPHYLFSITRIIVQSVILSFLFIVSFSSFFSSSSSSSSSLTPAELLSFIFHHQFPSCIRFFLSFDLFVYFHPFFI